MMPEDETAIDPKVVANALLRRHAKLPGIEKPNPYDYLFKKWDADPT